MPVFRKPAILVFLLFWCCLVAAQRNYRPVSVLSTGDWFKISVSQPGIYKLDLPLLNSLGLSGNIPSSQIRLYGNGGGMVPEDNAIPRPDDLVENAIWVHDGGDGLINGSDYILFYAPGPDQWVRDSVNKTFSHLKHLYSNRSFYFLTVGGQGKRVELQGNPPQAQASVTSFDERYFHETDSINFLNSGKEWYGEEFSSLPGRSLSRNFSLPLQDLVSGPAAIHTNLVARSINAHSGFTVSLNGSVAQQLTVPPVSASQYDLFAQSAGGRVNLSLNATAVNLTIAYQPGSFNSQGWLNWFEFFSRRQLRLPPSGQLLFRDWNSVGNSAVEFRISNTTAATEVWDITNPLQPVRMNSSFLGGQTSFFNNAVELREYVAFNNSFLTPQGEGRVANQDLHAAPPADYLIITHPLFLAEAERLATFHRQKNNLTVNVVTTLQVFNEFASGTPDPTAIRDFVKMHFDKNRSDWNPEKKFLLLFGKGSFDYKNRISNNTGFVPVYETTVSLDPLATYTSDDFFGYLEDHENINSTVIVNTLDIGIGRVPAKSAEEAKNFVDKLLTYHAPESFGAWRNQLNFIADDEDQNLHLQDAEVLTATVETTAPVFNIEKVYLDAFRQESGSAGGRYPQANARINSNIYAGTLIWNYSGHGGPDRLAEEVVLDQSIVNSWQNKFRLPLFITATCDFAPYDNPYIHSLGEDLLVRPVTGAIALMTTSRVVFAYSNRIINDNYLRLAMERDSAGNYKSLGASLLAAKNYTYQTSGDIINNRKFSLLGDPAMTLAYPKLKLEITEINGQGLATPDTLKATDLVTMKGAVKNFSGGPLNNFNGTATVVIFDKPALKMTIGNDAGSLPVAFREQNTVLFRGKATVTAGQFTLEFRMPKDINYQYGRGKISLYAENGSEDGNGFTNDVIIGGMGTGALNDTEGPEIKAFLNDESFINGGITNATPVLMVHLSDSSGINTGGAGIGHDIVATLDGDNRQYFVLNNFYESAVDDYRKGQIRFQLPELSPGPHTLHVKAWDALNNSGEYLLHFTVAGSDRLRIEHVLNYPNPFTTSTAFWFEHNMPATALNVKIEIFTVAGRLIKTLAETINTPGNRSSEIVWNGADEYGSKISRGVYLYRIRITAPDGKSAEKWEKLVILN